MLSCCFVQGLRIEFDLNAGAHWFENGEFECLVAPLLTNAPRKLTEVIFNEDAATEARCAKAFAAVKVCLSS